MISDLEGIEAIKSEYEQMELWQLEEIQKHYENILYGGD